MIDLCPRAYLYRQIIRMDLERQYKIDALKRKWLRMLVWPGALTLAVLIGIAIGRR
jgi:hypothetical protein